MELKEWVPDEYGIYFAYHVQHFDPTFSRTDSTKTMKINTTMVVAISRLTNLEQFKFEGFEGFIPLGKFFFLI